MKHTIATFKAYQNTDKDKLVFRFSDITGYSHIGQAKAHPAELNMIQCTVTFNRAGKRIYDKIKGASLLGAWRLESIQQS
jgi:hypothetical protein